MVRYCFISIFYIHNNHSFLTEIIVSSRYLHTSLCPFLALVTVTSTFRRFLFRHVFLFYTQCLLCNIFLKYEATVSIFKIKELVNIYFQNFKFKTKNYEVSVTLAL